jgi:hypothetical protein
MRARVPIAVLLVLAAYPAKGWAGTPGINLSWNSCATDMASSQRCYACDGHAGAPFVFQGSFRPDVPLVNFTSCTATLDITFMDASGTAEQMPDFWNMNTGGCAVSRFYAVDPDTIGGCAESSIYIGPTQGSYVVSYATGRLRMYVNWIGDVVPPPLVAGRLYPAFAMTMDGDGGVTAGCAGCATAALIVLKEIDVNGISEVEYITATDQRNWVRWQGTSSAPCSVVPTRNATWGAIKAMYR